MKIQPLSDHLLIEPLPEKEKTKSGLLIPATATEEAPEQGTVIAVGPGKKLDSGKRVPLEIKVGEKVLFSKYGPKEVEIDGQKYLIAQEEDILATLK